MISEGVEVGRDACYFSGKAHPCAVWVLENGQGVCVSDTDEKGKNRAICAFTSKMQAKSFKQESDAANGCQPRRYDWDDFVEKFSRLGFEKALLNPTFGPGYVWVISLKESFV